MIIGSSYLWAIVEWLIIIGVPIAVIYFWVARSSYNRLRAYFQKILNFKKILTIMTILGNIVTVVFLLYYLGYRYLWDTVIPWKDGITSLLMWRTNISPDNSMSIIVLFIAFFILAYRYRQMKPNFLFAGLVIMIIILFGIFFYEYIVIHQLDLPVLQQIVTILCATFIAIRFFSNRSYFRAFTRRLIWFILIITMPYFVWSILKIPYGFYYVNEVLHPTQWFNDPLTHLFSVIIWMIVCAIGIKMFPHTLFQKDTEHP
jgi:hypothetical protein